MPLDGGAYPTRAASGKPVSQAVAGMCTLRAL